MFVSVHAFVVLGVYDLFPLELLIDYSVYDSTFYGFVLFLFHW